MFEVEIINQTSARVPRQFLTRWLREMMPLLPKKDQKFVQKNPALTLVFLAKKEARELNHRYRDKDYATDVLSFDGMEPGLLGELIFCPEVLKKQAAEHRLAYRDELAYMVTHGVLHLLGYEHEKGGREEKRMMSLQDLIFDRLCLRPKR